MEASQREERVTPIELFFDLVFVFAITQVTSMLRLAGAMFLAAAIVVGFGRT